VAKKNLADLNCQTTIYITPPKIVDAVRSYFPGGIIPLDPATEPNNPLNAAAFAAGPSCNETSLGDGLKICWADYGGTFINPPYSREIRAWLAKLHEEVVLGAEVVALLPAGARYSTKYWQKDAFNAGLDAICFVKGRVKFLRPDGSATTGSNPYDSQIMLYNGDIERFIEAVGHLGKVLVISEIR